MTTYTFTTTFTNPVFDSELISQFASEYCISYKQHFSNVFEFYSDNFDCIEEAHEQFDDISTPIQERIE